MIGLCVKYWNHNYGSMLQCYAVTRFLKQRKIDYKIIRYFKKKNLNYFFQMTGRVLVNYVFRNDIKELLKKKMAYVFHPEYKKNDVLRENIFDDFSRKMFSNDVISVKGYDELKSISKQFNIVVSGSDQLLSPAGLGSHFFTLEFCDPSVKRVTWASSFGVSEIPNYQKKATALYLNKLDSISVREESGQKIIKKLTGKDAVLICDPVMMLTKSEWDFYVKNTKKYDFPYVFAYFLGNNSEYRNEVVRFAKEKGMKIISLKHLDQFINTDTDFGDFSPYDISPFDFLNLIRNAEYVFTDSFHGTVFSIINHKKFLTFNRYKNSSKVSKNSRITTIMNLMNLDRVFDGDVLKVEEYIDFEDVDSRLSEIREDSMKFLNQNLGVAND